MTIASSLLPVDLRVDGARDPLGIDEPRPELSWKLASDRRGAAQTAYQVTVAAGGEELWDSGAVPSAAQAVPYTGPAPRSRGRYEWRVRVADEAAAWSPWSEPAAWEMGLLDPADWRARWIGSPADHPGRAVWLETVRRIWLPGVEPGDAVHFRTRFDLPAGRVLTARLAVAPADVAIWVNGATATTDTVARFLRPGPNVLALLARDAVAARLEVAIGHPDADVANGVAVTTSETWRAAIKEEAGWHDPEADERSWVRAAAVGMYCDPPWGREAVSERPSPYLRRAFHLDGRPVRARVYATALGLYDLRLNGLPVTTDRLAPGWTDYARRVPYQCYDVSGQLQPGENVLAVVLADGWYAGSMWRVGPEIYGHEPACLVQLEVELADGTTVSVVSDDSWRAGEGAVRFADLLMGEVRDERLEPSGWSVPGFDDAAWAAAAVQAPYRGRLFASIAPPVRAQQELPARSIVQVGTDRFIVDFGQNLSGWVRLEARGARGDQVIVRHAEALTADGELYTEGLRRARQTDQFVLRGEGVEVLEPRFTCHGFRYAEVTGARPVGIVARAAWAAMEPTGEFGCSNPAIERLHQSVVWVQRGNFLTVPASQSSRDERNGFGEPAFPATAAFNMDVLRFYDQWLCDLRDHQSADGSQPEEAPDVRRYAATADVPSYVGAWQAEGFASAGYSDALVVVPWVLYRAYGDLRLVERTLPAMQRWLGFLERHSHDGRRPDVGFGDWYEVSSEPRTGTPKDLFATAYFAWSCRLTSELLRAAGRQDAADEAEQLYRRVRRAFRDAFVGSDARLAGDSQSAYVLAIKFGLLEPEEIPRAARRLVANIRERNWHLSTGHFATVHLLPVLADSGHLDTAYRLLLQDTYPSWLYMTLRADATTIWECWDTWSDHAGFHPVGSAMSCLPLAAVGQWLHEYVAGIRPAAPGYGEVVVAPCPGGGLTSARGAIQSVRGRISSDWSWHGDRFELEVTLPPNVRGEVRVPTSDPDSVTEVGAPTIEAPARAARRGVSVERQPPIDGSAVFRVGAGTYRFAGRLELS